jgi:anion-transporting  ArsA/GET3 family ATPase
VLTIDPAKRLAQALGLDALGNEPGRVAGRRDGDLSAMMLDMRRTFDEMVQAHAEPDGPRDPGQPLLPDDLLVVLRHAGVHGDGEAGRLAATGEWDLIIVDTPPSRSALDFLDAPQRMSTFLDGA